MDLACSKRNSASDVMPVTLLNKVKKETDTVCLFCQEGPARGRELRTACEEGRRRVIQVSLERRSLNDISSEFFISRILDTASENESEVSDTSGIILATAISHIKACSTDFEKNKRAQKLQNLSFKLTTVKSRSRW